MSNNVKLLRKLSPSKIMDATIKELSPAKGEDDITLYTIYGKVTGTKSGESTYGRWSSLNGNFEAVRTDNGDSYSAPACFIPEPLHSVLVEKAKSLIDKGDCLEFAVMVGLKWAENAFEYEYTCEPIVAPEHTSELTHLRLAIESHQRGLGGPEAPDEIKKPIKKSKAT